MTPIQESLLFHVGLDRVFIGFYLARKVGDVGTWEDLAESLGLTFDKMISLACCKAPRHDHHHDEDVQVVAAYVGMPAEKLQELLDYTKGPQP